MRTRTGVAILLGVTALFVFVGAAVFLFGGDDRRVGAINTGKSYAVGKYVLQTDGASPQFLGLLNGFQGCRPKGSVAKDPPNANGVFRKNIAGIANESCVLRFTNSMEPAFWALIADMAKGTVAPRSFQILSASFDYKVQAGIRLVDAIPTKFIIPQLDASGKGGPTFQLTLVPDSLLPVGSGVIGASIKGPVSAKKKAATNYVFKLGTLEMKRVNKLGPIEVSLAGSGTQRDVQISDFDVSLALVDAPPVRAWFDDFVIQGNNAPANEQTATLELTDASLKDPLMTFTLKGVGIFDVFDEVREASSDQIGRAIFSLYAEELNLTIAGGFPNQQPPPEPPPGSPPSPPPPPPPPTETTKTTPEEERKLAAPEELSGKVVGDREVEFTWTPVEGAESYVILAAAVEKEEPVYNELAESREPAAIIADLRPGTYLFVVRARAGESESENSRPIEIVIE